MKYANDIKDFGYITGELQLLTGELGQNNIKDVGGIIEKKTSAQALTPTKLISDAFKFSYLDESYNLTATEQLYTARGS